MSDTESVNLLDPESTLRPGESTTVAESALYPVYLELTVDDGDPDRGTDLVIETMLTSDEGDPVLSLYTADERIFVGRDDDGGEEFNARLVVCDLAPGRFLIEVDRFGDVGGFEISVDPVPDRAACPTP